VKADDHWEIDVLLEGSPTQAAVTLLRKGDLFVLVDSGWPRTRTQLAARLAARGVRLEQITHVLHTHLHIDHAANHPILGKAILLASKEEFLWADLLYRNLVQDDNDARFITSVFPNLDGAARDRVSSFIQLSRRICRGDFFSRWNEIRFYEDEGLPEGLSILPLPGHTPGHCGIVVEGDPLTLIAGDALTTEDTCLTRMPAIHPDRFAESAAHAGRFSDRIIPGHLPPFNPD